MLVESSVKTASSLPAERSNRTLQSTMLGGARAEGGAPPSNNA